MIKFIIHDNGSTRSIEFTDQSHIVIGNANAEHIPLGLDHNNLQSNHITIEKQGDQYFAINTANDPFAMLNGEPFGKRKIKSGDILALQSSTIQMQIGTEAKAESNLLEERLSAILEKSKKTQSPVSDDFLHLNSLGQELEGLEEFSFDDYSDADFLEESISPDEIDALVKEVEEMEWEEVQALSSSYENTYRIGSEKSNKPLSPYFAPVQPKSNATSNKPQDKPVEKPSPKSKVRNGSYVPRVEEDSDESEAKDSSSSTSSTTALASSVNWRWWAAASIIALLALLAMGGSFYFHLKEKRQMEELKAARGVADIAMALTYAHVNQSKPQKHNWTDPAFLKKMIGAVLSNKYPIMSTIDQQGQFSNSPYLLRIYTNHDFSQFLVMAQPAPSTLQSLAPKKTIVVDSKEMEMRKLSDLRELNRILVNTRTFDGIQADEISKIVKEGELIPLTSLANSNKLGFAPPKALAVFRPGAENRIYNAPRYYLFGERILNKILSLENEDYNEFTVLALQQELQSMEHLPNLVLYTTNGITKALHAQRALSTILEDSPFLVGYLKVNDEGAVISNQLLMKYASTPVATHITWDNDNIAAVASTAAVTKAPPTKLELFYAQLTDLKKERSDSLSYYEEHLKKLVDDNTKSFDPRFEEKFQSAYRDYMQAQARVQSDLSERLHNLMLVYDTESTEQLTNLVEAAGLNYLLVDPLNNNITHHQSDQRQKVITKIYSIVSSSSFDELNQAVKVATDLITLDNIPDPSQVASYQKLLYEVVILKLSDFLLSPSAHLPWPIFNTANRALLSDTLSSARLDHDTQEYFMNEFDYMASLKPNNET